MFSSFKVLHASLSAPWNLKQNIKRVEQKIIWPVWANCLSDKKVKNTNFKKKSPATEENEALNNERADLEVLPLATEKCMSTNADPVIESRSYRRSWSVHRLIIVERHKGWLAHPLLDGSVSLWTFYTYKYRKHLRYRSLGTARAIRRTTDLTQSHSEHFCSLHTLQRNIWHVLGRILPLLLIQVTQALLNLITEPQQPLGCSNGFSKGITCLTSDLILSISTIIHWSPKHFQIRTGRGEEGTEQREETQSNPTVRLCSGTNKELWKEKPDWPSLTRKETEIRRWK